MKGIDHVQRKTTAPRLAPALVLGALWIPSAAMAQPAEPKAAEAAPAPQATPAPAPQATAAGVPRDPKGIKGISPFWESIRVGDSAHLARDYDNAIGQYRDAITKEPQNPVGHLRIAEAQLQKGELKEADQSIQAALRFSEHEPSLKAKALFLAAVLKERENDYDAATVAWRAYQEFGRQQPRAKVHQRTPPERLKRIQTAKQLAMDYAAVKERIAKRLKEADENSKKNAK